MRCEGPCGREFGDYLTAYSQPWRVIVAVGETRTVSRFLVRWVCVRCLEAHPEPPVNWAY